MSALYPTLPPFALEPQLVSRIWGRRDLKPWYPDMPTEEPIGEAWLSGDACVALSGPLRGQTLQEICSSQARALLGADRAEAESPLLIKILFAQEKLSVQVHPDDAMAQRKGSPRGKTECWYALEAGPDAEVACGLKPGASLGAIEASLKDGTLEKWLEVLPVKTGEMIFVDAGTVHAIWPGSVLLETQQNSDITYRLYDYGRPRPLHVQESLEALRLRTEAGKVEPVEEADRTRLVDCAYFRIERMTVGGHVASDRFTTAGQALSYLFLLSGTARVSIRSGESVPWPAHTLLAVAACCEDFQLECDGAVELIRIVAK